MKTFSIVTPENVEFEYRLAGVVRRGLAWLFDQFLVLTALSAVEIPLRLLFPVVGGFGLAFQFVFYFALSSAYPILFEARTGQTPGKKALRIRVISDRGTAASVGEVVVRNLVRAIDVLPSLYLFGGLAAGTSREGRRLGDRAAGTLVVHETHSESPSAFRAADAGRHNTFLENAALHSILARRLTPNDREALLDLCLRREFLEEESRLALFAGYAALVRRKLARPELEALADERLVLSCVEALLSGRRAASREI